MDKRTVIQPTPEEDEEINRAIEADDDTWEFGSRRSYDLDDAEMPPALRDQAALASDMLRVRGKQREPTKEAISLRLDRDLVARLREGGPGWQRRINEMLRRVVFAE